MIGEAEKQSRQNQAIDRSTLVGRVNDAASMAVSGVTNPNPPTQKEFTDAYGEDGQAQWENYQNNQQTYNDMNAVNTMTPAQQNAVIDKHNPVPGEDYAVNVERQTQVIKAVNAVNKQRSNDPYGWAQQNNLAPNDQLNWNDNNKLLQQLSDRSDSAVMLNKTYGVPPVIFNKQDQQGLSNAMQQMGVQQKMQIISTLSDGLSDHPDVLRATLAQIAPKDPVVAQAASYLDADKLQVPNPDSGIWSRALGTVPATIGVSGANVAELVLKGDALISPTKANKEIDGIGKEFPMPPDSSDTGKAGLRNAFDNQAGDIFAGTPQAAEQSYKTYKAVYAALASDSGNYTGVIDPTIAAKAANYTLGNVTEINGKKVAPPWGMSASDFNDTAKIQYTAATANIPNAPKWSSVQLQNLDTPGQYTIRTGLGNVSYKGKPVIIDLNNPLPPVPAAPAATIPSSALSIEEGSQ